MSPAPTLTGWLQLLGLLGGEVVVVVTLAALLQRSTKSALWRRTLWQVCTLGLLALLACELSGLSRSMIGWATAKRETGSAISFQVSTQSRPASMVAELEFDESAESPVAPPVRLSTPQAQPIVIWWPGMIWLLGAVLVSGWTALAQLWFVLCGRRRRVVNDDVWSARVQSLARRLRIRRRIRLTESSDLSGPIAFGIFRPAISLPGGFRKRFTEAQQDAMLVHELAHLAAHDPVWYWLTDMVTALLWWHPLAWWFRRQLHAASEAAADEASLLIENGPEVLAECLVDLGRRLTQTQFSGWLGIEGNGFRSGLGRRVKRLVTLRGQPWQPMRRTSAWLAKTFGPLSLVAVVLASTAWTQPRQAKSDTLSQTFQKSVLGLALFAVLPDEPVNRAAGPSPSKGSELLQQQPAATNEPPAKDILLHPTNPPKEVLPGALRTNSATKRMQSNDVLLHPTLPPKAAIATASRTNPPIMRISTGRDRGREALARKLDAIVLDEVAFDGQPLSEVMKRLHAQASIEHSEGRSVNFILASGDLRNVMVSVQPTVKKVTLRQALDAVVKCASLPIRYRLEDYAVVFVPKDPPDPVALYTRFFKVEPDTFLKNLRSVTTYDFGYGSSTQAYETLGSAKDVSRPDAGRNIYTRPGSEHSVGEAARDFFAAAGVDFGPLPSSGPGAAAGPGNGKSLFFNDRTSILMVRATLRDLEIIDQAISGLKLQTQPGLEKQPPTGELDLNQLLLKAIGARGLETNLASKSSSTGSDRGREGVARKIDSIVPKDHPDPVALHNRWFKIDPNTLSGNLRTKLGSNASPASATNGPETVYFDLRHYITSLGIDLSPPKAMFFKDRSGIVMVRATLQDLEIIEKALQSLNTGPPQLTIDVSVAEITDEDAKALGFNWLPASATNGLSSGEKTSSTNHFSVATAGILTDPQYRVVIRALEQRQGVDLLTMPKVTTLSGRHTQIDTPDIKSAVIGYQFTTKLVEGKTKVVSNAFAELFELGPLVVVASVEAEGYTVQLNVVSSSKEFSGYEADSHPDSPTDATPTSVFRSRQFIGGANVYDGQTLVLIGGSFTNGQSPAGKVPVLGDMPPVGRLYRSEAKAAKRSLLIFVTPRLVDPAGNPLHDDEDLRKYFYKIPPQQSKP